MESAPCIKYDPNWTKRVQWVLNKLYDNLVPKEYQKRVGGLLCNCQRRNLPPRNDPFDVITDNELIDSVKFMDNFIEQNRQHANLGVFKMWMEWLRKANIIPASGSRPVLQSGQCHSVYRLLYILQQCLQQNHAFLTPPPPLNPHPQPEIEDKTLTFILEGCPHNLVGSVIGRNGLKLRPLLRSYKCHIKVEKVVVGDELKVKVMVTKKTLSMETLERVKKAIEELAKGVIDDENNFQDKKEKERELFKNDFRQILKKTDGMSRTAIWNDILRIISNDRSYYVISLRYTHDEIKQWFEEIQQEWEDPTSEAEPSSSRAFDGSGPSIVHNNNLSDDESDDTALKGAAATVRRAQVLVGSAMSSEPIASTSGMASNTGQASSDAYLNTAQEGRLSGTPNNRLSVCLVHDRRWVPTYQFTLTQCHTVLQLEKKYGRAFSRFVSSSNGPVPHYLQHFRDEADLLANFKAVKEKIQQWPAETHVIMQPLINQLDKGMKAETFQSLYRFVFLYMKLLEGKTEYLQPSYRLPYAPASTSDLSIVAHPETDQTEEAVRSPPSVVTSVQSMKKRKVLVEDVNESCYFRGSKRRAAFQCVVNYLHKSANMPHKYSMPFCKSVCCCHDDESSPSLYPADQQDKLRADCIFMKNKLSLWRGESKATIQQYIVLIEQFLDGTTPKLEHAFEKFVYYFNCAFKREYTKFVRN